MDNVVKEKSTELRQWLETADSDLTAAKYLSQYMQPSSYEIICFHLYPQNIHCYGQTANLP